MNFARLIAGVGLLGAVTALCGCVQHPSDYETAVAEITARHQEGLARVARQAEHERENAQVETKRRQAEDRMIAKMREPLARFLAETPRSCSSQHLADAANGPPFLLASLQRTGSEIGAAFKQRVGTAMVDIGDAVQQAGCPFVARQIFDEALRTFVGSSHAEVRLRAQFAIAYITRNATKWTPGPTQAARAN